MNPVLRLSILLALAACLIPAAAGESGSPAEPAKLQFAAPVHPGDRSRSAWA